MWHPGGPDQVSGGLKTPIAGNAGQAKYAVAAA